MKNSVFVLRTTTAILVSLSLAGADALAAGGNAGALQMAQNTAAQAGKAGGQQKARARLDARIEAALKAVDNDKPGQAQKALEKASEALSAMQNDGASDASLQQIGENLKAAMTALDSGDAEAARAALDTARTALGESAGDAGVVAQAAGAAEATTEVKADAAAVAEPEKAQDAAKDSTGTDQGQATAAQATVAPATEAQATEAQATEAQVATQPTAEAKVEAQGSTEAQPAAQGGSDATATQETAAGAPKKQEAQAPAPKKREAGEAEGLKRRDSGEAQVSKKRESGEVKKQAPAEAAQVEKQAAPIETTETKDQAKATETTATEATTPETKASEATATAQQVSGDKSAAKDATTVEEVNKEDIQAATSAGKDVVVKDQTSADDLQAQIEELQKKQADLESQLNDAKAVSSEQEVVTDENSRSATEEVQVRNNSNSNDNNTWKYLGAAAAGAAVGALVPALGGRLVQDQGDRMIVERGGEFFVRKDENQLLRQPGATVQSESFNGGITRTTVTREDGSKIVTLRNDGGFILRRTRITPDGQEIVLLEQTPQEVYSFSDWGSNVPQTTHRAQSVDYGQVNRDQLHDALVSQPSYQADQVFPLQAVRDNARVRELVPAVDLPITFASGSAAIPRSEVDDLTQLGRMMSDAIDKNPREIFLVEGHTDAVGSNLMNLALSDRRAEAVALALTEYFDIPPENLIVQGYGERFLKEQTEGASAVNRRATVRRITPLIDRVASR